MKPELVAATLEKAADLIETVGHAKGEYVQLTYVGDGIAVMRVGYCLVGALMQSAEELGLEDYGDLVNAQEAVGHYLNLPLWQIGARSTLIDWNDRDERTQDEVIDALKGAAKDIRNG